MIIPLGDGLELTEDKLRVPPGTLQDCLNYEIAYSSGYRRIDGFLRYDGQAEIADLDQHRENVQSVPNGPAYGLHFFPDWTRDEGILYAVVESTRFSIEDRSSLNPALFGQRRQRAEIYTPGEQTGFPNAWILEPQANFGTEDNDYIELLTDSDLSTGTLVAYTRVDVTDGQNIPDPGDQIKTASGSWSATVRGVTVRSGSGLPNDPLTMELWVEIVNGSAIAVGQELVRESDGERIGNVRRVSGWSSIGNNVGTLTAREGVPLDGNSGVLMRTTDAGWEPLEPAYEARFIQGEIEPANLYIGANNQTTAPVNEFSPSTYSQRGDRLSLLAGIPQKEWIPSTGTIVSVLQDDDGEYANSELIAQGEMTNILTLGGFGFEFDSLDEVTGMTVEIVAERVGLAPVECRGVVASTGGTRGNGQMIDAKTTYTFGSSTDLWGAASSESFKEALEGGLSVQANFIGRAGDYTDPTDVRLHRVRVIVYLRGSDVSSQVWLWDGSISSAARVLYTNKQAGEWDGTAEGIMTFARLQNPSLVPSNAQIRTADQGGGTLIGVLDGKVQPIRLPSRERMAQKKSRFEFINTNFFAAGRLVAAYGASGAGPAFTFNQEYLFRIRTGRVEDEPRHVARHADRLALGYENGDADFSVSGRPDLFDGVLDAYTLGFGQRITGMLPLTGGALGVWTEDSTHIVKGSAANEVQQQIISPTSGAIEYTVVDMGIPVFCDYRGINTLVASQRFGDFDMGRLSAPIRSWILPRLTALRSDGASRPVLAEPVQKKNQYRLWFADGDILTMTFLDDQQAKFTFQRWSIDGNVAKVIAATSGLDRELSSVGFASFEDTSYVYRLDHTDSFDGDPIPAHFTLNPQHMTGPGVYQRINIGHIHGIATGEFEISTQIGANYNPPSGHITTCTMTEGGQSFTKFRHKARARDFSLKVSTEGAPIHTLQIIEFPDISRRNPER